MKSQALELMKKNEAFFHQLVTRKHNLVNAEELAEWINNHPVFITQLIEHLDSKEITIVQLASWALGKMNTKSIQQLYPHSDQLLKLAQKPKHPSVRRNILKLMGQMKWNGDFNSELWDNCIYLLKNKTEPSSHHAYAIQIMSNIILKYPELYEEMKACYELLGEKKSAAAVSSYKNINKKLTKSRIIIPNDVKN